MTFDPSPRPGALGQPIDVGDERRAAVLRILEAGWKRAADHPEVHAGAGEVEITERLRDGMRAALNAKVVPWCKKMTVLPGTESRSSPDAPRPDGRTDVPIFFSDVRRNTTNTTRTRSSNASGSPGTAPISAGNTSSKGSTVS